MKVYGSSEKEMNISNYCVYRIAHLHDDMHYYGSKTAKGFKPKDIGTKYITSSTDQNFVKELTEQPDNFKVKIVSIHVTKEEALAKEVRLHAKFDVGRNDQFYNKANQTMSGFMWFNKIKGKVPVKDLDGNTMQVDVTDSRYLSGELVHICTGKVVARDRDGNIMHVDITDPRYISGELKFKEWDKVPVKDQNGNITYIDITDPRYISGELVHICTGKVVARDLDGNTMQVDVTDSRYLSGELVGVTKGKVPVKDQDGNTMQVDVTDSRYLSGELVHICTGYVRNEQFKQMRKENSLGVLNNMHGKHHSEESIKKMRDSKLGKKLSDETKKKMSISGLGRKVIKITKEKIRKSHTGRVWIKSDKYKLCFCIHKEDLNFYLEKQNWTRGQNLIWCHNEKSQKICKNYWIKRKLKYEN